MLKRLIIISLTVLLVTPYAGAQLWKQKRYEASASVGTSQFYGDIGGYSIGENALGFKDFTFKHTRFSVSGSARYFIIDPVAVRLSLSYIMLHATDMGGDNEQRGYEMSSSIFEPAIVGEYYFLRNRERNSFLFQNYRGVRRNAIKDFFRSLDVYVLTGIGGAAYWVNGNEELEARGLPDSGFTAAIPLGLGAKLTFNPNILFGIELCARYAFSDYIDGYTSQYSARNDVYHTFSFTFTYRIKTARNGLPSFRR